MTTPPTQPHHADPRSEGSEEQVSETKHTPGPWEISPLDGRTIRHEAGSWTMMDGNERVGEKIPKWEGIATVMQRDPAVTRANARLIAQAPALLAACRPVLAEAKERADYMHDTWNPDAHVELTLTIAELRAIRAAVDMAEGQPVKEQSNT